MPVSAREVIVAEASDEGVVVCSTEEPVIAVTADQLVLAGETVEQVVAAEPADDIPLASPAEDIAAGGADDRATEAAHATRKRLGEIFPACRHVEGRAAHDVVDGDHAFLDPRLGPTASILGHPARSAHGCRAVPPTRLEPAAPAAPQPADGALVRGHPGRPQAQVEVSATQAKLADRVCVRLQEREEAVVELARVARGSPS